MASLSMEAKAALNWKWRGFWARPSQLAPEGDWLHWLFIAGRGAGKTRSGAEWVREEVKAGEGHIGLIAPTAGDARDVMVEGESGLLSVSWSQDRTHAGEYLGKPIYEPSKRRVTWENGAQATLFSAEEPERLRGPQHSRIWSDEVGAWKYAQHAYDMAMFGLRLGNSPRMLVTTTPRPTPLLRKLIKDKSNKLTKGSTFENASNLAPSFLKAVREKYEGTRLGRQEIYAELLEDIPGAIFTQEFLKPVDAASEMERVVVAVDPSGASGNEEDGGDEIGIVVAGKYHDGRFIVLEDATCRLSPKGWAHRVVQKFEQHQADKIIAERNFGGDMVKALIQNESANAPVKMVTASRGKAVRAEPVAALYEQGRVDHLPGLDLLEAQMMQMTLSGYVGEGSPDRLDAMVWALTELMSAAPDFHWSVDGKAVA